mgnify:CR=1 FL=1
MLGAATNWSTNLVERYLPDPYVLVLLLTLLGAADDVGRAGLREQAFCRVAKNIVHESVLIEGQGRGR